MRIGFGAFNQRESNYHEYRTLGSGYENLAYVLGGRWLDLDAEMDTDYDVVLTCLPAFRESGCKKSPRWKKMIGIEEAGFGVINTDWYLLYLAKMGYDGFMTHTKPLFDYYKVFG